MPHSILANQSLPKKRVWSHTLFAHLYDSNVVVKLLEARFGSDHGYTEPQSRRSALFTAKFTQGGHFVVDSIVLSSEAWALGKIISDQSWARGFEEDQHTINLHALSLLQGVVTSESLRSLTDWILDFIDLGGIFGSPDTHTFRFRSQPVNPNKPLTEEDPLNSFILTDLADVADSVSRGEMSAPLAQYLSQHDPSQRRHVDDDNESVALIERLLPQNYALGCWPSERHLGLVHSQQLAVNTVLSQLSHGEGIVGINGPPGTGKTTLLRDLIAAIVTERADELAKLRRASDAFAPNAREMANDGGKQQWGFKLNPALYGFEIVIASSNNGAVENVTLELPQRDKIDESWLPDAGYFPELGELLTRTPAWGLISGALGSKARRSRFVGAYFHGQSPFPNPAGGNTADKDEDADADDAENSIEDDEPLTDLVDSLFAEPDDDSNVHQPDDEVTNTPAGPQGILAWLNEQAEINATRTPAERHALWQDAVAEYNAAKQEAETLRTKVSTLYSLIQAITTSRTSGTDYSARVRTLQQQAETIAQQQRSLDASHTHPATMALQQSVQALIQHHQKKPSLWQNIRSLWQAQRSWSSLHALLESQRVTAQAEFDRLSRVQSQFSEQSTTIQQQIDLELRAHQQHQQRDDALLKEAIALAKTANASHLLVWLESGAIGRGESIELSDPWQIEGWRQARSRVFIQALKLHKIFFQLEAARTRSNLTLINGHLTGSQFKGFSRDIIRSAWATLFMVVPVLSSTLASFSRSFGSFGMGEMGWLLVDEAGQATPQAAVGALWRSRRAVLVGDPLQLKPIVTVSDAVLEHLRTHYRVDAHWLPNRQSAQTLADHATCWGKMAGPSGNKSWVGLPLVVHRRCDKPMFELANRIAYDGAMVYGTIAPRPEKETSASLLTGWIHVKGDAQENWVPAEGDALHDLLVCLQADGVSATDIAVITPFKSAQEQLKRLLGSKMVCGTIHTMQGKEAAVVIMVLGGSTSGPGARDWAVSSPNLLNVAATRAKRRLYVIGDKNDWQHRALFCDVMDLLPRQTFQSTLSEKSA